jgi:group I intron endonuclease
MVAKTIRRGGVYVIRNLIDNKVYVGSAVDFDKRWNNHRWHLRTSRHPNWRLQEAWHADGEASFVFEVVEETEPSARVDVEQRHIDARRSYLARFGYNICSEAGTTAGLACSDRTRRLIGAANRGRKLGPAAIANKKAAMNRPEVKAKLKAIRRPDHLRIRVSITKGGSGKLLSPAEVDAVRSRYASGSASLKPLAAEYGVSYHAIRKACEGIVPTNVNARISAALTGRKLSPDICAKIGRGQLGRKHSAESRAKRSAALRAYHQARLTSLERGTGDDENNAVLCGASEG